MFNTHDRRVWFQSREDLNFPMLADYGSGRWGIHFTRGRHATGEWQHFLYSEDEGQTWLDDREREDVCYHGWHFLLRRDGTVLGVATDLEHNYGVFLKQIVSHDNGRTWAKSYEPAQFGGGYGQRPVGVPWNPPLELPDGRLLLPCYRQADDGYQVFVMERAPAETWWRRKSTVFGARPDTREGPNESCLALLRDGRIACVGRTGYPDSPLLWTRSADDGATWSPPVDLPWSGVDPHLYVMHDGLLLIFGARREEKLTGAMTALTSDDAGDSWSEPFVFYDGPGSSYHTAVRTGPRRLLVTYAESEFRRPELPQFTAPGQFNKICAVTLEVGV